MFSQSLVLLLIAFSLTACASFRGITRNQSFEDDLESVRERYKLPSLAAIVVDKSSVKYIGATGQRSIDSSKKVEVKDKYHLGSNTKSMTATLFARLVEENIFSWNDKLKDVLKNIKIHPKFSNVTLEQLLRHQGGTTSTILKSYPELWKNFIELQKKGKSTEQRRLLTRTILKDTPTFEIGKASNYSNAGISIVGYVIETRLGESFEELLEKYLFDNFKMNSCGFGTPGNTREYDEPRGHLFYQGKIVSIPPGSLSDNPDGISPAGKVHCSVEDWGKYIREHLSGSLALSNFLSVESYNNLHKSLVGQKFGLGWLNLEAPWLSNSTVLFHNGSNTMNYAEMWISPENNIGIGVVTNIGTESGQKAVREMVKLVARKYK